MRPCKGVAIFFSIVIAGTVSAQQKSFPILKGPYLGQASPGVTPEVFAPGIISTNAIEASLTFSYDDHFLAFRRGFREDTEIYLVENKAGVWTEPAHAPFYVKQYGFGDFTFSPNESVLYFTSRWPLQEGQDRAESANLWKVEYNNGEWLAPTPIGDAVNSPLHESYPSVSNDKTLFFFRRFDAENGLSEIMYSEFKNDAYLAPTRLGKEINTQWDEWDPSIAPDGSFLVFCSTKPTGYGRDDLYVSFKAADDSWSDAINLGDGINSEESENRPFITADGKYLFYNKSSGENRDVYWVDLGVVQKLRSVDQK
jgi:Tol biopolymer transport system component